MPLSGLRNKADAKIRRKWSPLAPDIMNLIKAAPRLRNGDLSLDGRMSNTPVSNDERNGALSANESGSSCEPYFQRIGVDTLVLSVAGQASERGLRLIKEIQLNLDELDSCEPSYITTVDLSTVGELEVQVHSYSGRNYLYSISSPGFIYVHWGPRNPALGIGYCKIQFGAAFWLMHTLDEARDTVDEILNIVGCVPEKVRVNRVDVKADFPFTFDYSMIPRVRGTGTRGNATTNTRNRGTRMTGYDNLGGTGLVYRIYDKRQQVKDKKLMQYEVHWHHYGVNPDLPIWRVEVQARRSWLTEKTRDFQIDTLDELNETSIRRLWGWFSSQYFWLAEETPEEEKRADRCTVDPRWETVNELAQSERFFIPSRVNPPIAVRVDNLFNQGAGCIAAGINRAGFESHSSIFYYAARQAVEEGETFTEYLQRHDVQESLVQQVRTANRELFNQLADIRQAADAFSEIIYAASKRHPVRPTKYLPVFSHDGSDNDAHSGDGSGLIVSEDPKPRPEPHGSDCDGGQSDGLFPPNPRASFSRDSRLGES